MPRDQFLFWNIRGVGNRASVLQLRKIVKEKNIGLVMLSEPMIHHDRLVKNNVYAVSVLQMTSQFIHAKIVSHTLGVDFLVSFVYASCDGGERRLLWSDLSSIASDIMSPWLFGGDFNVVSNLSERVGGRPSMCPNMVDFNDFMDGNGLVDSGYVGSKFTWCNNQQGSRRIWVRLDRVLTNYFWIHTFPPIVVNHLTRVCSDHSPLLVMTHKRSKRGPSPFRFQRMWVTHDTYDDFLRVNWKIEVEGSPMHVLVTKLKILRMQLKTWNVQTLGNIHKNLRTLEDQILTAETSLEEAWDDSIR
ncbi:Endonuclease/exonuclease/phosphatase [Macleaya cordata]|uniref:Endonuclease/exonuclease/phosphatase n=1 Tax=Macleaya cordata TaxID=56857 RepID=A0A200QUP3_MACCD|nr:Endonuclease/exonuclease/phosphatase [Macleaya cordata]